MFGFSKTKKTAESVEFESFAEATAQLKENGWSDEQINDFIRMSADKVAEEQDNQREYEAELTPEQRRKDTEYYAKQTATALTDGNERQPEVHEYSHTQAEVLERAKTCSKTLVGIFKELKKENPLQSSFDLYQTPEGRKAITQAVDGVQRAQASEIFYQIKKNLKDKGLETRSIPAMSYFREGSVNSGARFPVAIHGIDKVKRETLDKIAEKSANKLEKLYEELKDKELKENPDDPKKQFNLYNNEKGWKIITSTVENLDGEANTMLNIVADKLRDKGLEAVRSSISYFTEKSRGAGIQYNVGPIQ